jgi:hypothetical protein
MKPEKKQLLQKLLVLRGLLGEQFVYEYVMLRSYPIRIIIQFSLSYHIPDLSEFQ